MNGRFAAALVAFAVATAVVAHAPVRAEFFVQLQDPNLLAAPLYAWLLAHFGYAFVLGMTAAITAAAVLLAGWRTRTRGAADWYAGLAALLAALCIIPSLGMSLAPIGWLCASGFCLLLDREGDASAKRALALCAVWSFLQGGAGIGAVVALCAFAGSLISSRTLDAAARRKGIVALCATVLGALQLHDLPWHAYGAHALYLDALVPGAQRDRVWSGGLGFASLGFAALIVVAGWYGVRRRANAGDALVFFALLLLSLADARNLPYFGIVCAPIVADAVASYYLGARTFPVGNVRAYLVTFAAASAVFVATLTATEPRRAAWPDADGQPSALLRRLNADAQTHRVLCTTPRWCDGTPSALLDDRSGLADSFALRVQRDVESASGAWRRELVRAHVDAIVTGKDDDVAVLLASSGWRPLAQDGDRVLLTPGSPQ